MIATNGPLDGPFVESDAEILELYGDSLSRRDRVRFGSTEDMTGFELADLTGVIGGGPSKPLPIRPDAIVSPDRPPLREPPRAKRFDCLAFGASCRHTLMVDGTGIATPLPCGECSPCREWRVFKIMVRYRHGMTAEGQAVICLGWPTIDAARQWATKQGRRAPGRRVALLRRTRDYRWDTWVIYAHKLTANQWRATSGAMTAAGKDGNIVLAPITAEFQTLVSRDACVEGLEVNPATGLPIRRRTCVFTAWQDYEEEPNDCAQDDGVVETGILNPQREPTPLPGWAKALELLPFEERSARHAENWCYDVGTVYDYVGPSWLPRKTREWLNGKALWRECYRPMLRLLGAENKAPPTVCQGCGRAAQLTPKGLCIRCALR